MVRDTRQHGLVPHEDHSVCSLTHSLLFSSSHRGENAGPWVIREGFREESHAGFGELAAGGRD